MLLFIQWLLHQNICILWVFIILLTSIYCLEYNAVEFLEENKNKDKFSINGSQFQASKEAQKCFLSSTSITFSNHHPIRNHHRFRRAPAVWGDPAPDYSLAELDPFTNIYLYALLFVDLKMSDHYRRDHTVVKREVMRLAKEANNYFYQINLRLIVVDVLETFRDDLSLYTFELYRNSKMAQLPFHDFAVLISYRYAGGLAFVGGMCNSKSVMLAGFYPHNPEAMASIFFHEVAHLIGVPHRPENETLEVSNCACNNLNTPKQNPQNKKENNERERKLESKSSFISDRRLAAAGCLKIPGFDQDCTLQLMVNLALRTRCLLREPKAEAHTYSLAICGNGVHEEGEECDCGLEEKCNEWNCEPEKCIRRWKPWAVWLLAFILCLIVSGPFLLWLLFPCAVARLSVTYQNWPLNKCRRSYYHFFLPIPPFVGGEENNNNKPVKKTNILACQNGKNIKQKASEQKTEKILLEKNLKNFEIKATRIPLFNWFLASRIRSIWERIKWSICSRILAKRRRKKLKAQMIIGRQSCYIVKRPVKPPPPPPPIFKREISYSSKTLNSPKITPPPLPSLPLSSKISLIRPNFLPPSPPHSIKTNEINNNTKINFNEYFNKLEDSSDDDENRWNDDYDDD